MMKVIIVNGFHNNVSLEMRHCGALYFNTYHKHHCFINAPKSLGTTKLREADDHEAPASTTLLYDLSQIL